MTRKHTITGVGAVLGALGVAAGAFGAHALADIASPERIATWETAARYHLIHAVALVAVAMLMGDLPRPEWALRAAWMFLAGILLFSGSLYALVLLDIPVLGAVTPLGGVALIGGWLSLAAGVRPGRSG